MISLLDAERQYYVIKRKFWGYGSGDIYDETGNTIGKISRKMLSMRSTIVLAEADGTTLFTVSKKLMSLRTSYDIKDSNDELLGRTKKKIFSFFKPTMWVEDAGGRKLLIAQGSFNGWRFTVKDNTGRLLGQVRKSDALRDIFLTGVFNFSDTYTLEVTEPSFDRSLLLGLVIAIDNSVHDRQYSHRAGFNIAGFHIGRRSIY